MKKLILGLAVLVVGLLAVSKQAYAGGDYNDNYDKNRNKDHYDNNYRNNYKSDYRKDNYDNNHKDKDKHKDNNKKDHREKAHDYNDYQNYKFKHPDFKYDFWYWCLHYFKFWDGSSWQYGWGD